MRRLAGLIDGISAGAGRLAAWLVLALVLVVVWDVSMRYLFQSGSIRLQELEWHLFSLIFLLGASETLRRDGHVRVDVMLRMARVGPRGRAVVDLVGTAFLMVPFCLLVIVGSLPFVEASFQFGERSPDPGGLPARYVLKAAIPVGFGLLLLQGVAVMLRSLILLLGRDEAGDP